MHNKAIITLNAINFLFSFSFLLIFLITALHFQYLLKLLLMFHMNRCPYYLSVVLIPP